MKRHSSALTRVLPAEPSELSRHWRHFPRQRIFLVYERPSSRGRMGMSLTSAKALGARLKFGLTHDRSAVAWDLSVTGRRREGSHSMDGLPGPHRIPSGQQPIKIEVLPIAEVQVNLAQGGRRGTHVPLLLEQTCK